MFLTREQFFQTRDTVTEEVKVGEGTILVRGLSATEREDLRRETGEDGTEVIDNLIVKLVAKTVVNEDGSRMFTENDIKELGKKSALLLDKIFIVSQRLSGLGEDALKEIEKK